MRVRLVSPWYPDYGAVHSGIFVAKQVAALRDLGLDVFVDVPQIFPAPPGPIPDAVTNAMRSLAAKSMDAMFSSSDGVTYVPTPVPARGGPMGRAEAMTSSLSLLQDHRQEDAEVVHAHVGMPAAWAVARTIGDRPLVVTEHWSGLSEILEDPVMAAAYSELLERANAFVCVSEHLREEITRALGERASEKIAVVPNIVDLTDIAFRPPPDPQFRSWIYVGGLMHHKGVQALLESFHVYVRDHEQSARLTLVGDGPLRDWIGQFAASHGLGDAVTLAGSVEHTALGRYLEQADVMVHLSQAETFGIASLEGIGAGLPVVSLRNMGSVGAWGDIAEKCGTLLDLDATPTQVADAVAELRDSPGRLDPAVGREAVEARFSAETVATRLRSTYRSVLS